MCRHCVVNPQAGSNKPTRRKGCSEENEEFYPADQTKVGQRSGRMATVGSGMRREKEGGWLSWKQAIQKTILQEARLRDFILSKYLEDRLRDLMLSKYSYASIPFQQQATGDADLTEMQGDECLNLKEEKVKEEKKEKEKAVQQVVESPGWFQKEVKSAKKAKDEDKARVDIMSGWM